MGRPTKRQDTETFEVSAGPFCTCFDYQRNRIWCFRPVLSSEK